MVNAVKMFFDFYSILSIMKIKVLLILKNCQVGEPVFLTKNGRGRFVVMDIEDYERDKAEKKLLEKLQEAEAAVKDGNGCLSLDELKTMVEE